jgi:prolipoprotein diacylglyceryltransferase
MNLHPAIFNGGALQVQWYGGFPKSAVVSSNFLAGNRLSLTTVDIVSFSMDNYFINSSG